jgi:hypothetical protein
MKDNVSPAVQKVLERPTDAVTIYWVTLSRILSIVFIFILGSFSFLLSTLLSVTAVIPSNWNVSQALAPSGLVQSTKWSW